LLHKQGFK